MPRVTSPRWDLFEGMPCWIELVTAEPDKACEFYAGLFGWQYESHDVGRADGQLVAYRDGFPVASIRTSEDEGSRWRLYLAAADHDATVARAESLGGDVTADPGRIPGIGTRSVLMSPADIKFGLLEPEADWQFDVGLPGTLMWAELVAIKVQSADSFFGELFGYGSEQFGTEHRSDYSVWYLGSESVLARVSMIREFVTPKTVPHWLLYLGVESAQGTDELVRRAITLGGRVRVDPYDSSIGRVAVLRDPTGARFAIVDSTQALTGFMGSAANYDPYDD
ncbi:VOC family protein [Parasphingorhabdus pacifica]